MLLSSFVRASHKLLVTSVPLYALGTDYKTTKVNGEGGEFKTYGISYLLVPKFPIGGSQGHYNIFHE